MRAKSRSHNLRVCVCTVQSQTSSGGSGHSLGLRLRPTCVLMLLLLENNLLKSSFCLCRRKGTVFTSVLRLVTMTKRFHFLMSQFAAVDQQNHFGHASERCRLRLLQK